MYLLKRIALFAGLTLLAPVIIWQVYQEAKEEAQMAEAEGWTN